MNPKLYERGLDNAISHYESNGTVMPLRMYLAIIAGFNKRIQRA
jgi:hypothetical protein